VINVKITKKCFFKFKKSKKYTNRHYRHFFVDTKDISEAVVSVV